MSKPAYVILTPARNEEAFIEGTIKSVLAQTMRPARWVIINDASSDRTGEIIETYARQHDFLKVVNLTRAGGRDFARKALAVARGLAEVGDTPYDFVGNLDADITLEPDYYERILGKFAEDPRLGLGGGTVHVKIGDAFLAYDLTPDSVGGQMQMFRRQCFEEIGGYPALELGGIDAAAEITARMKGWTVAKFPELRVCEHRRTGTANAGILKAKVVWGRRFYSLGYSPLFYILRCAYRVADRPVLLGSLGELYGFFSSMVLRKPYALPAPVVHFLRQEQKQKLCNLLTRCRRRRSSSAPVC